MNKRAVNWLTRIVALVALSLATSVLCGAQNFITLYNFGGSNDGAYPNTLVQATDGNLYGTSYSAVFRITPVGDFTVLDSRLGAGFGPLIQASDGNLYGATSAGQSLIRITLDGTITTLHNFNSEEGSPVGALVEASDGRLYGATVGGADGDGTLFAISLSGDITLLHSFNGDDGKDPLGTLVADPAGYLYGVTDVGGAGGAGVVFVWNIHTQTFAKLHDFVGDDGVPYAPLVRAHDGNLYGTTFAGGPLEKGTIYQVTPAGAFRTVHAFDGSDGAAPQAPLIEGNDHRLYGAAVGGGASSTCGIGGCGTLFTSTFTGALTSLLSFGRDLTGSQYPFGLVQHTNGRIYGVTLGGSVNGGCSEGCGTIYAYSAGLPPFVESIPNFASVGARIRILSTKLTNASRVTFNGIPAKFSVVSPGFIKATVPAGATTGPIKVETPSGVLTSNMPFEIVP